MDDTTAGKIPESLRYKDGNYVFERMPWLTRSQSLRGRRILSRSLHALHKPFFLVRIPLGVCVLTTTGRKTGKSRRTYVKAIREGDKAYLVSIPGAQALWLKNIQANPAVRIKLTHGTYDGVARKPLDDAERQAAYEAFCGSVHVFDYFENAFHRSGVPSRSKIIELHRAWFDGGVPLVVELGSRR